MQARAKSSNTPYPIWVYGEYMTNPPERPRDGAKRPEGDYIDKGGYPGANVYEVDMATFCMRTAAADRHGREIYVHDILLHETEDGTGYLIVEDESTVIDAVWGEIMTLESLHQEDMKVIGNMIDDAEFIEGLWNYRDSGMEIPYVPLLDPQLSACPYFRLQCTECGKVLLGCRYRARCECGGILKTGFTTKVYREKERVLA